MRHLLVRWLRALLLWLEPLPPVLVWPDSEPPPLGPTDDEVLTVAIRLTDWADQDFPDTAGEFKRHQVYARLIDQFPQRRRRDLGKAIEDALQR